MAMPAIDSLLFETKPAKHVKEAAERGLENLAAIREETADRVKHAPMTAIGVAFGSGALLGALVGYLAGRPCERSVETPSAQPVDEQC